MRFPLRPSLLLLALATALAPEAEAQRAGRPRSASAVCLPGGADPLAGLFPLAPTASNCCADHSPGTGCDDATCEELVCGADPFCCFYDGSTTFGWDAICAEEANSVCGVCGGSICGGSTHNCCQASSGPPPPDKKCNDPDCCGLICEVDPVCCVVEWDAQCRDEAKQLCGTCWSQPPGDCCTEHPDAGCNVESCAQSVCEMDPDCCDIGINSWSASCVGWALELCAPTDCGRTLTVIRAGSGTGTVADTTPGGTIACPSDCTETYGVDTAVTLTATPTGSSTFGGWTGACIGTGACELTMSVARTVTATFNPGDQTLNVAVTGSGTGSVTDGTAGDLDCAAGPTGTCTDTYPFNTVVTLTATPSGGATFAGWSGEAAGCGTSLTCNVTMSEQRDVGATFQPPQQLNVTVVGGGSVTDGAEGDLSCSAGPSGTCADTYPYGTVVTLTRTAPAGWLFGGWSGDCAGTATTCQVTMSQTRNVTATWRPLLTVTKAGAGAGSVADGAEGDITCPGTCSDDYPVDQVVTLTAMPTAPSTFAGWTGDGTGTGTRSVTMEAPRAVTATFDPGLSIAFAGAGSGTVTDGAEGDIDCTTGPTGTCSDSYPTNQSVTLTAAAQPSSVFTGWIDNGCSGTGTCVVAMSQVRSVTATFQPLRTLGVTVAGGGTVTDGAEGDISCSSGPTGTCSDTYPSGTVVTLTRAASAGWLFFQWSGDVCNGSAATTCQFTIGADRGVTATFHPVLTVARSGGGSGTITDGAEGDINCGATCTDSYAIGTGVTLTATPVAPSGFGGWSGDGTGGGTRTVEMDAPRSVTATFDPGLAVTISGDGTGSVTDGAEGDVACAEGGTGTCADSYGTGTAVDLTAAASGDSTFTGWGGDCSFEGGDPVCNLTLAANRVVTATFQSPRALAVTVAGPGTVADTTPGGSIACPGDCAGSYAHGASVSLTATPIGPAVFEGWTGDCSGTGACALTMSAARSVTATFGNGNPDLFDDGFESGTLCAWSLQSGGDPCPP